MMHIFRKEIKRWHAVLWVVLASLGLSSLTVIFQGGSKFDRSKIAKVNGQSITAKEFKYALSDVQQRLDGIRRYAQMLGISEDVFLQNYYKTSNPQEIALTTIIKEKLIDQVKNPFNLQMANEDFVEFFVNSMPDGLLDERGRINMSAYTEYVRRMGITAEEFEARKEAESSRQLIERFVLNSFYVPRYALEESLREAKIKKSFVIASFPYQYYIKQAKTHTFEESELKAFYEQHKDEYRVPEKRSALYWRMSPELYANKVVIDDVTIEAYYEKNKSSQFRVAPKVRIRRILVQGDDAASKAKALYDELKSNPSAFAQKAREVSSDKEMAKNGGLTDFFSRGTHEKAVEDAAFRLQKVLEISDVIKTSRGYELIQLDERINAREEALDNVKEKIIKTLIAKRALENLKSDLEIALHESKENSGALAAFAKSLNLKQEESDLLSKDMVKKPDFMGKLAEKLFSGSKRSSERGYFFDGASYVIYQFATSEKAFTRKFQEVEAAIQERYADAKAHELMAQAVQKAKSAVLAQKGTLDVLGGTDGVHLVVTPVIGVGDSVKNFAAFKQIAAQAFQLTSSQLLLQQKVGNDYCLVQVKDREVTDGELSKEDIQSEFNKENSQQAHNHMNSFIASLQIHAKIERFDEKPIKNIEEQS